MIRIKQRNLGEPRREALDSSGSANGFGTTAPRLGEKGEREGQEGLKTNAASWDRRGSAGFSPADHEGGSGGMIYRICHHGASSAAVRDQDGSYRGDGSGSWKLGIDNGSWTG